MWLIINKIKAGRFARIWRIYQPIYQSIYQPISLSLFICQSILQSSFVGLQKGCNYLMSVTRFPRICNKIPPYL